MMAATPKELRTYTYETADGKRPFDEWLDALKDRTTLARIASRLNRVALGNHRRCEVSRWWGE
jgi:putative component of toxin-antitoxin plasmid stabilization module